MVQWRTVLKGTRLKLKKLGNKLFQWLGCKKMRVSLKTAFVGREGDRFEKHLGGKISKALYCLELVEGNEQSKIKAKLPDMIYKKSHNIHYCHSRTQLFSSMNNLKEGGLVSLSFIRVSKSSETGHWCKSETQQLEIPGPKFLVFPHML